jgi:hypothetical protein
MTSAHNGTTPSILVQSRVLLEQCPELFLNEPLVSYPERGIQGVIGKSVSFCFLNGSHKRSSRIAMTSIHRSGVKNVNLCNNPL